MAEMLLGQIRRAKITEGGNLLMEFWEGRPDDADPMTWFSGNTVRVLVDPISVTVLDDDEPLARVAPELPEPPTE